MLKKYIHLSKEKKTEIKQLISDEFFKLVGKSIMFGLCIIGLALFLNWLTH